MDSPRRVLLIAPFGGARWRSISAYAQSLREMLEAAGIEVEAAEAPWFNPPSLAHGWRKRWWRQPQIVAAQEGRYDVVHLVDHGLAQHARRFRQHAAVVTTCHDVMPFTVPGYYASRREAALKRVFLRRSYRSLGDADIVVAVSSYTAGDGERVFAPGAAWVVVPNIVRAGFAAGLPAANPPERMRVLSVGNDRAYKNTGALIEAMARPALAHAELVRVGPLAPETKALAESLDVARRTSYPPAPDDSRLAAVYASCSVLAQPSLAEGFGIPVIEAMACGLPVVTSDGGALPEVAGDAGIVVPLASEDFAGDLAAALSRAANDRARLGAAGRERARTFSAAAVTPILLEAYRQAMVTRAARE